MSQVFRLAEEAEQVEYKAYTRHFSHDGEGKDDHVVLFVVATMTYPDTGWVVNLVPQEGDEGAWLLLEDEPAYRDNQRTFVVASGTTDHEVEKAPEKITVQAGEKKTTVSVVAWD